MKITNNLPRDSRNFLHSFGYIFAFVKKKERQKIPLRMKPLFYFIFTLLAAAAFFISCKKDTTVIGTVTDRKTGEPIAGAFLAFSFKQKKDDSPDVNTFEYVLSGDSGQFSYENDKKFTLFASEKTGYLSKGYGTKIVEIRPCQANEVIFSMVPFDSGIDLTIENTSTLDQSVYITFFSAIMNTESIMTHGLINLDRPSPVIQGNQVQNYFEPLASGEFLHIYWDFIPIKNIMEAAFHDSIYVPPNDTVLYSIKI